MTKVHLTIKSNIPFLWMNGKKNLLNLKGKKVIHQNLGEKMLFGLRNTERENVFLWAILNVTVFGTLTGPVLLG